MEKSAARSPRVIAGVLFYCTTKPVQGHFDYTFRVADALLRGHAGLATKPPSWLNEFVLVHGRYYSVFPLGAVPQTFRRASRMKMGKIGVACRADRGEQGRKLLQKTIIQLSARYSA